MFHSEGSTPVPSNEHVSRRDFLRVGAMSAGAVGLTLSELAQAQSRNHTRDVQCIMIFLVGGPSHLDTWDLKPAAPSNVRGPFKPICTNVPGMEIAETFPQMAKMADKYSIVRTVHHDSAPIHETGHQLMQTGRLSTGDFDHPHYGAVLSHLKRERVKDVPPFVILPEMMGSTGVSVDHGQSAGFLGEAHQPVVVRPSQDLKSDNAPGNYGKGELGQSCFAARRLIEKGTRFVTINAFDSVFDKVTWDCHADGGSLGSSLHDYKKTLCPEFDQAYTALLEDLDQRGMLESTLVVAMGEFGRTPHLNPRGGRDHWPGCWSILFAGGGIKGGQIVGASDRIGAEPRDRPVTPAEVAATIYHQMGVDLTQTLATPDGEQIPLVDANPITELL